MTTYDPAAWSWCRCVTNPLAAAVEPATYLDVDKALIGVQAGVVAVGLVTFLLIAPRPPRGAGLACEVVVVVLAASWLVEDAWQLFAIGATSPGAVTSLRDAALVALPFVFVVGYAAQRPSRAHVADLLLAARGEPQPSRLRDLVARAIGDPRTTVAWWDGTSDSFRDHLGRPVAVPESHVLAVEADGRPIALVLSDRLDLVDAGVRDSVAQALLLSSENRRLTAELQASLEQVRDSRARILTASDETRRRIERDLHDGAQQLLISTGIKLNLAATRAGEGDTEALAGVLEDAQTELHQALSELRGLASGIAPTALVHGTLDNALRELALHSPVPTTVRVTGDPEPDEVTAATAYFVAAECLTNVAKHANASRAMLEVTLGDPVLVRVIDNGKGGARLDGSGTGLRGLVDRVEARGGRLEVVSNAGGTTIEATVPDAAP
jgi:signal transduction histidine kinase